MSEPRNTILQLPDTLEYVRLVKQEDGEYWYTLCISRDLATPLTKADADYIIGYYQHMYMITLTAQDWIIINAKHTPDEKETHHLD